ncbi:hypothetical protein RFI_03259 [Reticulomyxa filosa]|uniref:DUF4833 domain-containing protein n=1 Tax=Reticulomyxa filosa TaxID=46433 RepID=X6P6Y2_RETFI|nr:hypothetical protein RFI_03259 [Reticulomyxa filosa]|eukprot:ETO33844.1 hypothetical protein RFI_03259 [Reticulomyxa filosa]
MSVAPIEETENVQLPTEQINKDTVMFWIERSKNGNIVVYEGAKTKNDLKHFDSIDGYWLDIDPDYVKVNRSNGKKDDRSELSYLERTMAYGCTVDSEFIKPDMKKKVSLVALPQLEAYLVTDTEANKPYLTTKINGKHCILKKVYVKTQESIFGMPKVNYIEIYGVTLESKKKGKTIIIKEKITN